MTSGLRRASMLALLMLGACDPSSNTPPVKAEASKPDATKAAIAAAAQQKKAQADDFAVCMAGCIEAKPQSPTDRQTCRLTCGADQLREGGPGPSPATVAALARFETCIDQGCTQDPGGTDAATCRLTCAQSALAGEGPAKLTGKTRGCAVSCLEQVGDCEVQCPADADDAATCALHCQQTGRRCLGRCEQDPKASPLRAPAAAPPAPAETPAEVSVPKKTREGLPSASPESAPADAEGKAAVPDRTRKTLPAPP